LILVLLILLYDNNICLLAYDTIITSNRLSQIKIIVTSSITDED